VSRGIDLTNVTIESKGTIDGSGAKWRPPVKEAKKNNIPEPKLNNVKIEAQEGPPFILESGAVVEGLEQTNK
jgi:hypothetical protein